jgi:hypothetical protein
MVTTRPTFGTIVRSSLLIRIIYVVTIRPRSLTKTGPILSALAMLLLLGCGTGVPRTNQTPTQTPTPAPSVHSVNLAWAASTTPNVSGYNIYRAVYAGSCGHFSKIASVRGTNALFLDSDITGGASYCYAVTAVSSTNEESVYSNVVSNIQIPTP